MVAGRTRKNATPMVKFFVKMARVPIQFSLWSESTRAGGMKPTKRSSRTLLKEIA